MRGHHDPGEIIVADGEIILNADRDTITMKVSNTDRPVQIGSHYHFAEANIALKFNRSNARGMQLILLLAADEVRTWPDAVRLAPIAGKRRIWIQWSNNGDL